MGFKPNYRLDRAERNRAKEAKKQEKREAQAARREAGRVADATDDDTPTPVQTEDHAKEYEDHDGAERTSEE